MTSPLVAWLGTEHCVATGKVFFVQGGTVKLMTGWTMAEGIEHDDRLTIDQIDKELSALI